MAAAGESSDRPRSRDSEDQGTTPRPPKKRFLASASSSPTPSVDGDHDSNQEESADSVEDPLEIFRKDAIARQWKEYMRLGKRWRKRSQVSQDMCKASENALNTWDAHFQQFSNALKEVFSQTDVECVKGSLKRKGDELLSSSTVSEWASENAENLSRALSAAEPLSVDLGNLVQDWRSLRGSAGDKVGSLLGDDQLTKDYNDALSQWNNSTAALLDAKSSFYTANAKKYILTEEMSLLAKRIEVTEEVIRDLRIELVNAENRLSSRNKASEKGASRETDKAKTESERLESDMPANGIAESLQESIVRAKSALDQQLHEIEVIKDQRIDLKQQIARVEMDLVSLPEERIYKTHPIRELYQAREYHRDKSRHLAGICHKLRRDIEDLQHDRRGLLSELDKEQMKSIVKLQEKLRSLDQQLTSIRGERDALQVSMEEYKAYGGYKRASTQELRAIADARKERASLLEMEFSRLQRKRAASTGIATFYESTMKNEDIDAAIVNMEQQIASTEKQLKEQLARSENGNENEEIFKLVMDISRIQRALLEFKDKYGFDVSVSDENEAMKVLEAQVADHVAKIADTRQKIQNMETMENQLLGEIETVARAYGDLEGRNMKKLDELLQMESEVSVLQGERSRYSQAFTSLNKSKDAHAMVATALTKQVEKELTYVKEFNEREKNINSQLVILDRELSASKAALQLYEQREAELKEALKELKEKNSAAKDRAREMEKAILERIGLVEQGAHERLRLEENSELLRRKLQASSKVEKPAEMKLRKEKEEYRALLNCSSCRTRLKSHVLMRCMHTFCKDCLDSCIETRQRRCPSCGESFGVNDVRQFYF